MRRDPSERDMLGRGGAGYIPCCGVPGSAGFDESAASPAGGAVSAVWWMSSAVSSSVLMKHSSACTATHSLRACSACAMGSCGTCARVRLRVRVRVRARDALTFGNAPYGILRHLC